ncbi:MAG TPA: nitroreductase family protein [Rubricoccaceae bacterium]
MDTARAAAVDQTIRDRKTVKLHAEAASPTVDRRAVVDELLAVAGWAPLHRPAADVHRGALSSPVPWRFYALDAAACRALRASLGGEGGKVLEMLAAADALVQATWLPDEPAEGAVAAGLFEPTVPNMEHVAAAGAAIQNLLLAATARGIPTYWSSGGVLRTPAVAARLGIPEREVLLGSIYLFPEDPGAATPVVSKLRETRGDADGWSRWVDLNDGPGARV